MTVYLGNKVVNIMVNGVDSIFRYSEKVGYVSLGDSIAAGHAINDDWYNDYDYASQYGENNNDSTVIVSQSYTDLITQELRKINVGKVVSARSFAHSGDTVADLMEKLSHDVVRKAIAKASFVTICIGANDVLQPALMNLDEYIYSGDLSGIEAIVESNLERLNTDSHPESYIGLFNRLNEINPNAKYVFTTVYNPYKYLYMEEGQNGFFAPLLSTIPDISIFGLDIDSYIKDGLLNTSIVQMLFSRINGLHAWAEKYVTRLNQVLTSKINSYKATNSNFYLADTKSVFDTVPDRPISAEYHYNDLVNVEYTRGYDTMQMDWGRMYEGTDAGTFWWNLATKYVSLSGIDIEGFANELIVENVVNKVILLDIDPHPEWYGHYRLKRAFAEVLGWESLDRYTITFNANGGLGSMSTQTLVSVDGLPAYSKINDNIFSPTTGYYFNGWNTKADGSGTSYSNRELIGINSDIVLYAQWSNLYTLTFKHKQGDVIQFDSGQTGPMECYALWIEGVEQSDLGAFSNPARTYTLPYGTNVGVIAQTKSGDGRSYVTLNGTTVAGKSSDARYSFSLTGDTTVEFEWNQWLEVSWNPEVSYWNCYITTN